ncbi:MAG: rhomboid family intramembrane serine protease [Rudaea sp.]|nr:rhomboid family intramembrane serine protease [Rudaea sp.]
MLFFPYKLDISLYRLPYLTVLVCLVCLTTFLSQQRSASAFARNLTIYCTQETDANLHAILESIDDKSVGRGCANVFMAIRESHDHDREIAELARKVNGLDFYRDKYQDLKYKESALGAGYANFETLVPRQLTEKLAYGNNRYDFVTMLTSTFAHASWSHILGNLLFFFIFASCIESAVGSVNFFFVFVSMAIVTSLAYSYSVSGPEAVPSIGLSGVAMGMMAMLTTMMPRAKIWCFFWFLLYIRRFTLPVVVIAAWYVGWNIYDLTHHDPSSRINYMAHVSGAASGFVLGLLYKVFAPQRLESLVLGMNS